MGRLDQLIWAGPHGGPNWANLPGAAVFWLPSRMRLSIPCLPFGCGVAAAEGVGSVRGSREGERARRDSEMGKGGELWDDSALVDAFDRAVATYKVRLLVTGPDGFADRRLSAQLLLGFRVLRASRDRVGSGPATL